MKILVGSLAAIAACVALSADAQGPKAKTRPVPPKITASFRKLEARVKETPARVIERKPGEFVKTREIASNVSSRISPSDFADKPYVATLSWTAIDQQTKIYGDEQRASEAKDWLPPGKLAGTVSHRMERNYTATFYLEDGEWVFDEMSWSVDAGRVVMPPGMARPRSAWSTKGGDASDWVELFLPKESQ